MGNTVTFLVSNLVLDDSCFFLLPNDCQLDIKIQLCMCYHTIAMYLTA